ncbi:MAG: phosphoenolpyruvate--protein phosphotransferase [Candidatus Limnocylindrales bacterium]|jgi:phosphoenolpyruvate-protein phosphotransferase
MSHTSLHLAGIAAAPGIAVGPIWRYRPPLAEAAAAAAGRTAPPGRPATGPDGAVPRLRSASEEAARQLEGLAARVRELGRAEEAEIFEAQALMATDAVLLDEAIRRIEAGGEPAAAVQAAAETTAAVLAALDDELLAARAADVRDVGARIARILTGDVLELPDVPSIAVADDLPPSVTVEIPPGLLTGIALAAGSRTAHAVILARSLAIPAIVGVAGLLESVDAGVERLGGRPLRAALNGETGELILDPGPSQEVQFHRRQAALTAQHAEAMALRDRPCATADGERVLLVANIGSPDDAPRALEARAEGVGLFRTEFLFMSRQTAPTEAEQVEAYRRVLTAFGPHRPVVIRLADIGGDKAIPYLGLPHEANPFLGVRAIRLAYTSRDLLLTQLRAIWRAGALAGVVPHVMAPMIATVGDVELFLSLRDEARDALLAEGLPCAERVVSGIMVEIPSAAILAADLAQRIDFFSIGTNDLTQYTLAADRGNAILAPLQDALHPAVLRLIASVVAGADAAGIPVAVCGELAGDPAGALVLVALGVDELSADAASLDGVRAALAGVTRADLDELARIALATPLSERVRALATELAARGRRGRGGQGSGQGSAATPRRAGRAR